MKQGERATVNTIRDYVQSIKNNNESLSEEEYTKLCKQLFDDIDDIFTNNIWNSVSETQGQEYEPYYLYNKYLYADSHDKNDPNYHFRIIEPFPINVNNEPIFYNNYFTLSILKMDQIRKPKQNEFEEVKPLDNQKIVVSIGLNPSESQKKDDEGTRDKVEEMKNNVHKSPRLEATRRNAIKATMSILEKENASLKYFVQLDLYTDRSNNAKNCDLEMTKLNVNVIHYWLNRADIIIPAWGSYGPSLDPLLMDVTNDILKYQDPSFKKEIYRIKNKSNKKYKYEHFATRNKIEMEKVTKDK